MRKLSDTVARLAAMRGAAFPEQGLGRAGRLTELTDFGSNPGTLRGHVYIPDRLPAGAALVVVLHGCTQTAAGYDEGAGWSEMADRHGFALLFPEQQRQNNPNLCFNWFSPEDSRRGSGEALSIRQMIAAMAGAHEIDPRRIFVTGLSAGGAMASVMLATYPEVFAGGAIIAGLPYGCATTVPQAFDSMRGHGLPSERELVARVRAASDHAGRWPTVSIWHGSADATVSPANATAIIGQWRGLHGVGATPSRTEAGKGFSRRVWCDRGGREVIESYSIAGLGHGTPLATAGEDGCGRSGPFMLETGVSSTHRICRFWGLIGATTRMEEGWRDRAAVAEPELLATAAAPAQAAEPPPSRLHPERPSFAVPGAAKGVGKVIEDALRAAGLMR